MALMSALGVHLGFGFSAGLFDYVLNFTKATKPLMLVPVGLVWFGLYYAVFRLAIVKLNLKTPGREDEEVAVLPTASPVSAGALSFWHWAARAICARSAPAPQGCVS
jgi:PTS system N-acetylglucosamine-specific IIC component